MPNNGDRIADVMRKELARARPMIPKEYKMPDLSELDELTMSLIHLVFGPGDRNASRGTALNLRIYLRLVDKAVDEYESARRQIVAQLAEKERSPEEMAEDGRIIYMFKFVDHMENCILTVRRIIRCLDRLKRNQDGLQFPRLAPMLQ